MRTGPHVAAPRAAVVLHERRAKGRLGLVMAANRAVGERAGRLSHTARGAHDLVGVGTKLGRFLVELFSAAPGCSRALFQRRIFRHWRTSVCQKLAQLCPGGQFLWPTGTPCQSSSHAMLVDDPKAAPRTSSQRLLVASAPNLRNAARGTSTCDTSKPAPPSSPRSAYKAASSRVSAASSETDSGARGSARSIRTRGGIMRCPS